MGRLERGWAVVVLWGLMLLVLTVLLLFWRPDDPLNWGQLALSAVPTLVLGYLVGRRGPPREGVRGVPDVSASVPLLAFGLTAVLAGVPIGAWMSMIGAGLVALAVGGLVRERRAERKAAT